jgi:hypothetical protein
MRIPNQAIPPHGRMRIDARGGAVRPLSGPVVREGTGWENQRVILFLASVTLTVVTQFFRTRPTVTPSEKCLGRLLRWRSAAE